MMTDNGWISENGWQKMDDDRQCIMTDYGWL